MQIRLNSFKNIQSQLARFDSISLQEMDKVALLKRTDTKFVLTDNEFIEILPELWKHYKCLKVNDMRMMNYYSQYFDTQNLDFFFQHHRGKARRIKVRKRCYMDSNLCFLEIKRKNKKGETIKKRMEIDEINKVISTNELEFLNNAKMPKLELQPILTNSFSRITLVSKTSVERLTIDLNLKFNNAHGFNGKKGSLVIVELKQPNLQRTSPAFRTLKQNGVRPASISKYCIGVSVLIPKVKQNNFKEKFRTINKKIA